MPLDNLFTDDVSSAVGADRQQRVYQKFGVLGNPFPSGSQNTGNPHKPTGADEHIDAAVKSFYTDRRSHVIAVTASHGIGKTNLLNAYEAALREKLSPRGFFVIRYVADPEPSFDPLVRSLFEHLGVDHLRKLLKTVGELDDGRREELFADIRSADVRVMVESLESLPESDAALDLAHEWLIGLPVRKAHRDTLGVQFRIGTVESKTRVLRDIVYLSAGAGALEGVFLLLDELEKQDASRSKTVVVQYLSALRALIDALPRYLFLMVAVTPDALQRYREMVPALKGRLADQVDLLPLHDATEAEEYRQFYLAQARREAREVAESRGWGRGGRSDVVTDEEARAIFDDLWEESAIEGVRQREFLNAVHREAEEKIEGLLED